MPNIHRFRSFLTAHLMRSHPAPTEEWILVLVRLNRLMNHLNHLQSEHFHSERQLVLVGLLPHANSARGESRQWIEFPGLGCFMILRDTPYWSEQDPQGR